jgi:hypothetical protein
LHFSIFAGHYVMFGWPLEYFAANRYYSLASRNFNPHALAGDLAVWLAITAATGFVVERWVSRVEQSAPMRKRAICAAALAVFVTLWILDMSQARQPEWYDYLSWFFGLIATIYAAEVLVIRHGVQNPKISLLTGIGVVTALWFVLSPLIQEPGLLTGLLVMAGAFTAMTVDVVRRSLMHRDKGARRFILPECGEHVAVLPMWAIGLVGVVGGLVLTYT